MAPARAALGLLLLLVPITAVADSAAGVRASWQLLAANAPGPGEAVAARLSIDGPGGAELEVRAWLRGATEGAQVWTPTGWTRSDRYGLDWALEGHGHAEGWVAVRARALGDETALCARVRDASARVLAETCAPLAPADGAELRGLAPGAAAVGAWREGRLIALAPTHATAARDAPWDVAGAWALRAPPGATLRPVDATGVEGPSLPPPPPSTLRITSLLVDAPGQGQGEFVRVGNVGSTPVDLAGWWLRGPSWEAVVKRGAMAPGEEVAVAADASAYAAVTGRGDVADAGIGGRFGLPDAGGRVELGWSGHVVDAVAWGRVSAEPGWEGPALPLLRAGQLHRRAAGWPDTDRALDFDATPWMAAWRGREPTRFEGEVTPFTRETSLPTALAALAEARREVLVEVYELTHPALASALEAARARGARVRVLVEGAPVGGVPDAEKDLLASLAAHGVEVLRIGGSGADRYATMHAKFAVLDGTHVLLGSENWTPSGFRADGRGNFGWGAWVRSPALAAELASVWAEDADLARGDVEPWDGGSAGTFEAPPRGRAGPAFPGRATLLLAPDNAGGAILEMLARANATLDLEALQLPRVWSDGPNPVKAALEDAARRGVRVRALLDGSPGTENAGTAEALNAWAAATGAPLEARLAKEARVHNKGIVVDAREALVGSVNFGEAAMTWNREAALVVEGSAVGVYQGAFEQDWALAAEPAPKPVAEPALLAGPLLVLVAAGVWRARRRADAKAPPGKGFR